MQDLQQSAYSYGVSGQPLPVGLQQYLVARRNTVQRASPLEQLLPPVIDRREFIEFYDAYGFPARLKKQIDSELQLQVLGGYSSGLEEFMKVNGVKFSGEVKKVLLSSGLEAMMQGLQLNDRILGLSSKNFLDFTRGEGAAGYRLGFLVGLAREYGITADEQSAPSDTYAYSLFKQGSKAVPSFIGFDDEAYILGLRVWLASNKIEGIKPEQIRHPDVLGAFLDAYKAEPDVFAKLPPGKITYLKDIIGKDARIVPNWEMEAHKMLGRQLGSAARAKKAKV